MSAEQIWTNQAGPGGWPDPDQGRKLLIFAKDISSTEQVVPVPVVFGRARIAGIYITPIWKFRSVAVKTKMGK